MICKHREAREERDREAREERDREIRQRRLLERMRVTAIAIVLHQGKTVEWALDELAGHPFVGITIGEYAELKRQVQEAVAQYRGTNRPETA